MSNQQNTPGQDPRDAWQEVGRQFQTLGDSLSEAFRAAWQDERNRQRMEEMRIGVESMVNQVGRVLSDYAESPEGQRFRADAKQAASDLRNAGEQTVQEARPHLVSALKQVNAELQRMIDQMEGQKTGQAGTPPERHEHSGDEYQ
jgi:predicted component of type VI protein secretion system